MTGGALQKMSEIIEGCGINGIECIEMRECAIRCTCKDEDSDSQDSFCATKHLNYLIKT